MPTRAIKWTGGGDLWFGHISGVGAFVIEFNRREYTLTFRYSGGDEQDLGTHATLPKAKAYAQQVKKVVGY